MKCQGHEKRNDITMKPSQTYLLKVAGDKHEIDAAETQLGYTQEDIDQVSGLDGKRDRSKFVSSPRGNKLNCAR